MKTEFQKQVEAKAFKETHGYFGNDSNFQHRAESYYSGYCDGAKWQRNRVWHPIDEKPDTTKLIIFYDTKGGDMSAPCHTPFPYNYDVWAYMDDLTPIEFD